MEKSTKTILAVLAFLGVVGAVVAIIVLLVLNKDDDDDDDNGKSPETNPPTEEPIEVTEDWNTRRMLVPTTMNVWEFTKSALFEDGNGDNNDEEYDIEDAKELCIGKAKEIDGDSIGSVCAIQFSGVGFDDEEDPELTVCHVMTDCLINPESIKDSTPGVETLFTMAPLFCDRPNWVSQVGGGLAQSFANADEDEFMKGFRFVGPDGPEYVVEFGSFDGGYFREHAYSLSMRIADKATEEGRAALRAARSFCLLNAYQMPTDQSGEVCGINFYPDAFTADHDNLSNYDQTYPCQIFRDCTNDPGFEESAEGESETIFAAPALLCSNHIILSTGG